MRPQTSQPSDLLPERWSAQARATSAGSSAPMARMDSGASSSSAVAFRGPRSQVWIGMLKPCFLWSAMAVP